LIGFAQEKNPTLPLTCKQSVAIVSQIKKDCTINELAEWSVEVSFVEPQRRHHTGFNPWFFT